MGDNQDTANNDLNLFSQVQSTHTIAIWPRPFLVLRSPRDASSWPMVSSSLSRTSSSSASWLRRDTLVLRSELHPQSPTSSSAQHTPKKLSESKVEESANLPPSSRSDSSSQRTPSPSTPLRSKTVVSPLSPNASPSDTSSSTVLPSAEHAMVSSDSSWRVVLRVARLSSLESCVPLVRRA